MKEFTNFEELFAECEKRPEYWKAAYEHAKERIAELEKDKARLDWIENGGHSVGLHEDGLDAGISMSGWWWSVDGKPTTYAYITVRDAIDAAMKESE